MLLQGERWARPPFKFHGNPLSIFCVIPLTNQQMDASENIASLTWIPKASWWNFIQFPLSSLWTPESDQTWTFKCWHHLFFFFFFADDLNENNCCSFFLLIVLSLNGLRLGYFYIEINRQVDKTWWLSVHWCPITYVWCPCDEFFSQTFSVCLRINVFLH